MERMGKKNLIQGLEPADLTRGVLDPSPSRVRPWHLSVSQLQSRFARHGPDPWPAAQTFGSASGLTRSMVPSREERSVPAQPKRSPENAGQWAANGRGPDDDAFTIFHVKGRRRL